MSTAQTRYHTTGYMPQLDGLRAFAVGAVLIHHFWGMAKIGGADLGLLGVWLFFVLSGFLITGILLRSRDQIHNRRWQPRFALRQFYVRRFLRIFPLYYFVLCVAAILSLGDVRDTIGWHLTYLSNYLFAAQGYFGLTTGHFWSLSVEEQFYILWPAVVLFTPKQFLSKIILVAIAIGPAFRLIAYCLGFNAIVLYVTTFACLDTLGLGALLAYCSHHVGKNPKLIRNLHQWSRWLSIPTLIVFLLLQMLESSRLVPAVMNKMWFIEPIPWALLFVCIISGAAPGFTGITGKILELEPITYMGKISYGIYVYHFFTFSLVPVACSRFAFDFSLLPLWLQFGLLAGVTIGVAAISWHLFENPLSSLKNYFTYPERNAVYKNSHAKAAYL
jgi:peptidoglycan/LPS O-acetylase OafA/YrhL